MNVRLRTEQLAVGPVDHQYKAQIFVFGVRGFILK